MRYLRSIRARFTGWYLLVLAILLILLAVALYSFLSFTLQRSQDQALQNRAMQLAGARETRQALESGIVEERLGELIAFFQPVGDGYRVVAPRLVENDVQLSWIDAALRGQDGLYSVRREDGTWLRFYISRLLAPSTLPLGAQGQSQLAQPVPATEVPEDAAPVVLVIGQPMDRTIAALAALRIILLIAIPSTLLLSALGGLFLVRRALKPIDRMIETARSIEETDLASRIPVLSDDELGRLARILNAMFGRLARAFQRQRQFTDDASHELRAPLSVIEAEASLALRKDRSAQDYRQSLSVIAQESETMSRLIEQLLTMARNDAGEETLELRPVDLKALIEETICSMTSLAAEKGLQLTVAPMQDDQEIAVFGDETQLKRVLVNLVENAVLHTEAGGEIVVSVRRDRSTIEWRVMDTGCGIDEEHAAHIFERFYRVDKTRSRQSGGSGLGLAICRQIIEAHAGTITVVSTPGQGSSFLVVLPAA